MKPLWLCDLCHWAIYPYTHYVVVTTSWNTSQMEHLCGDCWALMCRSAAHVLIGVLDHANPDRDVRSQL